VTPALIRILTLLALLAIATPLTGDAQPAGKVWRIAYLSLADSHNPIDSAFDDAVRRLGYREGQNLAVHRRFFGKGSVGPDDILQEEVRRDPRSQDARARQGIDSPAVSGRDHWGSRWQRSHSAPEGMPRASGWRSREAGRKS
jgi:hypothetical protein